jgi:hypothetical protein
MERGTKCAAAVALAAALAAAPATGAISRQERKAAEKMLDGRVYLRLDAPCNKGRHPYGIYYSPLVEVSPAGSNMEGDAGASFGWFHAQSTVWSARINDEMELDELDWDDDEASVEVELEGKGDRHTVLKFVGIRSLADFRAAFEHAFSPIPLQEHHPDWSAEIRQAIGERRLVNGMTKRQAYYVVGMPARVAKSSEEGKAVETWTLQQQGLEIGFFGMKTGNSGAPPEMLRFEDGQLVSADVARGSAGGLDLDD